MLWVGVIAMNFDTVLFDLDGTLLNTLDDLWASGCAMMEHMGLPPLTREQVRQYVGNGMAHYAALALPGGRDNPRYEEALAFIRSYYDSHCLGATAPYPGTVELLRRLKEEGVATGVVSNKPHSAVVPLIEHFFPGLPSCSMGQQEGLRRKPAPDMVNAALEQLGRGKERTLYVGDSEVDVKTAQNAGLPCLCVGWGFRDRQQQEEAGALYFADTAEEALEFILG
jgi:phosphoglycolate phosphatase